MVGSESRSRAGSGSGSIPLTSGSGSGRPKNTWIRIRIRNTVSKYGRLPGISGEILEEVSNFGSKFGLYYFYGRLGGVARHSVAQLLQLEQEAEMQNSTSAFVARLKVLRPPGWGSRARRRTASAARTRSWNTEQQLTSVFDYKFYGHLGGIAGQRVAQLLQLEQEAEIRLKYRTAVQLL